MRAVIDFVDQQAEDPSARMCIRDLIENGEIR